MSITVAAFYHFFPFNAYIEARKTLRKTMQEECLKGTMLLSPEGINATIAGPDAGIKALLSSLGMLHPALAALEVKLSPCEGYPFKRAKVKLKKELITLGLPVSPLQKTGMYADAKAWNALLADPEVVLLDARNIYEVEMGSFKGAVNPDIRTFRQLPDFVRQRLDAEKHRKIATFCTGGIRCEKFTAFLLDQGFKEVYQLKGGILQYLNDVPKEESLWEGECFVFDERQGVS